MLKRNLGENYSPLYFLAALGPGGLAVSFFMYLMFLVPHQGVPMPAMEHWLPMVQQGGVASALILAVLAIIIALATTHVVLLVWNLKRYVEFKKTDAFNSLKQGNGEVTLMALPLTIAMSINLTFIAGSLFLPNLWSFIQPLFPIALTAFTVVGVWALVIYARYMMRVFEKGNFNHDANNSFAQLLAPFAFSMVAVGLAAPGAMSHNTIVSGVALTLSTFFAGLTMVLALVWLIAGLKQVSLKGFDKGAAPTVWILIPILTLMGITFVRQTMGLHHNFGAELQDSHFLQVMSVIFGLQLLVGVFGHAVMKKMGYYQDFVHGKKHSPASFGLICPGVALVVFGFFFINYVLVMNGIVDKYSLMHWVVILPLTAVQLLTAKVMFGLIKRELIEPQPISAKA